MELDYGMYVIYNKVLGVQPTTGMLAVVLFLNVPIIYKNLPGYMLQLLSCSVLLGVTRHYCRVTHILALMALGRILINPVIARNIGYVGFENC